MRWLEAACALFIPLASCFRRLIAEPEAGSSSLARNTALPSQYISPTTASAEIVRHQVSFLLLFGDRRRSVRVARLGSIVLIWISMIMGTTEIVRHAIFGAAPAHSFTGFFANTPHLDVHSKAHGKYRRRSSLFLSPSSVARTWNNCFRDYRVRKINDRSRSLKCQCQRVDDTSGMTSGDANRTWFTESVNQANQILGDLNGQKVISFENGSVMPNNVKSSHSSYKTRGNSIEDEAWHLLQDSVVYYCGSPVGTIAATDPSDSSSNVLNYDQVFIRDFIPSGMAFLLKGEYDIVRNFILHTLQLQVILSAAIHDCDLKCQGLMPASFKVRTVPLDGDDSATEEVLDPDFGEAAIGRVAPVDSGVFSSSAA
ncbi:hypothetical protein BHE74_00053669 [Ensete ventricosum]|nr:hypothetical protein BHE74_00053669 [Ensete ventricosum]